MLINKYEQMLSGGHPNSLGNTLVVVEDILKQKDKLADLYDCYSSSDAVVRLRVSNAFKRICKQKPDWVYDYLDKFIDKVSLIDQASAKWTLSTIFLLLDDRMNSTQRAKSIEVMKNNLFYDDWIVQNTTADSLAHFAKEDDNLKMWLIPKLKILMKGKYKSVARRSQKILEYLQK